MIVPQHFSCVVHRRQVWLSLFIGFLLSSFFLVSCSGLSLGGSATPTAQATPSQVALSKLRWCNKPFIVFRDEHAPLTGTPGGSSSTPTATATTGTTPGATATVGGTPTATTTPATGGSPTTVTDWSQVEPNLGFTIYLPATLPRTACLVSVYGTLHDPIFGGNFIIGYQLADGTPISLSEAPMRTNNPTFQCTVSKAAAKTSSGTPTATASATQVPLLLCTGARDTTNIVFSARGTEASLKQFFDALQPNIHWVPASS
ncbi:MAG: hypothetical protein ABI396_14490 [Ktedonobacteraceae bacterium]